MLRRVKIYFYDPCLKGILILKLPGVIVKRLSGGWGSREHFKACLLFPLKAGKPARQQGEREPQNDKHSPVARFHLVTIIQEA